MSSISTCRERAQRLGRRCPELGKLGPDAGERPLGEVSRERPLDAIHGGDEEVAGAHRDVGHAKVEELVGGLVAVLDRVDPFQVIREGRFEGAVKQVLDGE